MGEQQEFIWHDTRDAAIEALDGRWPSPEDEEQIVQAFASDPRRVIAEINSVAESFSRGEVRSPWGLIRSRVVRRSTRVVVVEASQAKAAAVARAEQWIRTAGLHFDRQEEVHSELFDEGRQLHAYADDEELADRLLALWRDVRPRGEQVEAEAVRRAAAWKASRAALNTPPLRAEPETVATPTNPFL